jgi:hypothetical protein
MTSERPPPPSIPPSIVLTTGLRSYFAAVGGDAPAFEAWPRKTDWYLHEYLLSLWGCLIGEMFDLEVCFSSQYPCSAIIH